MPTKSLLSPLLLLLFLPFSGCTGPTFEDYLAREKESIDEIKVSLLKNETVLQPGTQGFDDLAREVLHVTYEIDAVEQAIVQREKTYRMQNESDYVQATLEENASFDLPNQDGREETSSIYVVFASNVTTLAGKPLLCHQDVCSPYRTTYDLQAVRDRAEAVVSP